MYDNSKKITLDIDPLSGELTQDSAKRYFSRFGWFCFAMIAITFASSNLIDWAAFYLLPAKYYNSYFYSEIMSFLPIYCVALPISFVIISRLPSVHPLKTKMGVGKWFGGLCISMLLMMAGNYISLFLMNTFGELTGQMTENPVETMLDSMPTWMIVLSVVIIAPILEELLFRGIVCKKLLALGEGYAIILSGAFFALFHGNFYQLFYTFGLGCFLGFIYVKTGKLIYTVLYHAVINLFGSVVAMFIQEKRNQLLPLLEKLETTSVEELDFTTEMMQSYMSALIPVVAYELIYYAAIIIGIVLLCTGFKKLKCQTGMLPPPKKGRFSALFLNSGIAIAIAAFTAMLFLSLLIYRI